MEETQVYMRSFKSPVSDFQLAVATATALMSTNQWIAKDFPRQKLILIKAPPASGKTRIALAFLIVFKNLRNTKGTEVVFIHPYKEMLVQDQEQFDKVKGLLEGEDITLHRTSSYKEAAKLIKQHTIVICDEFDYQLFDKVTSDPFGLFIAAKYSQLIALTATTPAVSSGIFGLVQKRLGFYDLIPIEADLAYVAKDNFKTISNEGFFEKF